MSEFKKRLTKSLVENGQLTPSTIEEIKLYLQNNEIEEIPSEFELLITSESSRKEYKKNSYRVNYSETEENLAQAAREGKEIPDEIKKKMENDRSNSNS